MPIELPSTCGRNLRWKMRTKLICLFILVAIFGCGGSDTPPNPPEKEVGKTKQSATGARFRGRYETERILSSRVLKNIQTDFLHFYLGNASLASLLGQHYGEGLESGFNNGYPNALTMLVWQIVMQGFAADLASVCEHPFSVSRIDNVSPKFVELLLPVCHWPEGNATSDAALSPLWQQLLQYDAPLSHYESWKKYFVEQRVSKEEKSLNVVTDMIFAALYSPYFLLER